MKEFKIRNAGRRDLELLLQLNEANLPHVSSITLEEMEHLYDESRYLRIAESEGQLAGFLIGLDKAARYESVNYRWFTSNYDEFMYIDRIVVSAAFRRRGVGSLLYRDLEAFTNEHRIPRMACEYNIRPPNEDSKLFHSGYGFREVGTQDTEGGKKTVSLQIKELS